MKRRDDSLLRPYLSLFLILPDEGRQSYRIYKDIVNAVNMTELAPEEILSFNLYHYNRKKAQIEMIAV